MQNNKFKMVSLDGIKNGIAIYIYKNNDYLKDNKGKKMLFNNLAVAKAYAYNQISRNNYEFSFSFMIDNNLVNLGDAEYVAPYYEYYDKEKDVWYFIKQCTTEQVLNIGYFVFQDGDDPESTNRISRGKSDEFFESLIKAIDDIVKFPDIEHSVRSIQRSGKGIATAYLKGSTTKMHILQNSNIMNLNNERKEKGIRCIPYEKSMDKLKTMFMYSTANINGIGDIKGIQSIIEMILEFVQFHYPNFNIKFIPVKFNGIIKIEEGEV